MSNASATQAQRRKIPLNLRVSEDERALIAEMARNEGLPVATFVVWTLRKEAERRGKL